MNQDPAITSGGPARASTPSTAARLWASTRRFRPVAVVLIVLFAGFSITQDVFLSAQNLENLLTACAMVWIVAMGMTFVLLTGGFDLSVGAVAAFCGVVLAKVLATGVPGGVALLTTLVVGGLIGGFANGLLVGRLRLSVFVVTLATLTALAGVVNLWTHTTSQYVTAPIVKYIAIDSVAGIPVLIWVMAALFVVGLYLQSRTYFGRDVYAIGGNEAAARLAGIRTWKVVFWVYALMGTCSALAGVIAVGRVGAASPQVDTTLALTAIAAVLIGGTTLAGGAGGIGGTALGVLFVAVLQNGLALSGVASAWQQVVTGIILVVAVMADRAGAWTPTAKRMVRAGTRTHGPIDGFARSTPAATSQRQDVVNK